MFVIGEMAEIVQDVKTIDPPEFPVDMIGAMKLVGRPENSQALGAMAVIADRMYGLLPEAEQNGEHRKVIINAYASWMIAASVLDDVIDEPGVAAAQKEEYLRMGQEAFFGKDSQHNAVANPALELSLGLFTHAGKLIAENSPDNDMETLEPPIMKLIDALKRQDDTFDTAAQTEIAATVGGVSIAAPVLFARAMQGKPYANELSAALALGDWAQRLDNIRDMAFDKETGQMTPEVIELRDGKRPSKIFITSLHRARKELKLATTNLSQSQKRTINAIANLMFMRYILINPAKTLLRHGTLTTLAASGLKQEPGI